jgi:lipid A disaccharide synthetase
MVEQGFEVLHSMDKLGVRGYAEVLKQYREIRQVQKDLIRRFLDDPPALFIGIDSSDFNLDIERKLKRKGVRVVHYVSPAIWAWRGVARAADRPLGVAHPRALSRSSPSCTRRPACRSPTSATRSPT